MKRSILAASVLAASLAQASGSALVVPPPPPWPPYCDIRGMSQAVRELVGYEVVHDIKRTAWAANEGPPRDCPTFEICAARDEAQKAIWAAEAAVRRVDLYQRLRAYAYVCESAGY